MGEIPSSDQKHLDHPHQVQVTLYRLTGPQRCYSINSTIEVALGDFTTENLTFSYGTKSIGALSRSQGTPRNT